MNKAMEQDIERILITKEELEEKVAELGRKISEDYADAKEDIVFIGVLKGCFVFMADLMRHVTVPCCMDFMAVSSYGSGTTSSGAVEITKDLREDIGGTCDLCGRYPGLRSDAALSETIPAGA